jgi:hypothetical protein
LISWLLSAGSNSPWKKVLNLKTLILKTKIIINEQLANKMLVTRPFGVIITIKPTGFF